MIKNQVAKILMVSTEYPPMHGGVGRYTFNLVRELRKKGLNVLVVCNKEGDGDLLPVYTISTLSWIMREAVSIYFKGPLRKIDKTSSLVTRQIRTSASSFQH